MDTISAQAFTVVKDLLATLVRDGENFSYVAQSNLASDSHLAAVIETAEHSYVIYGSGRLEQHRGSFSSDRYEQTGE